MTENKNVNDKVVDVRSKEFLRIFRETFGHTYAELAKTVGRPLLRLQQKENTGTLKLREAIRLAKFHGFDSYIICENYGDSETGERKEWKIESEVMEDWIKDFINAFGENQTSMGEALGLHRQKISLNIKQNSMKFRTFLRYLDHLGCRWCVKNDIFNIVSTCCGWSIEKKFEKYNSLKIYTPLTSAAYVTKRYLRVTTTKAWLIADDSDGKDDIYTDGVLTELYISKEDETPFIIKRYREERSPSGNAISMEDAKTFIASHGNNPALVK